MAETLAVVGSILLLLGVTGGIQGMATKLFSKDEFVPLGDRIWATLIGGTLVGLAVVLETGSKRGLALWIMLGIGAVIVTGYSGFLWSEYRHDTSPGFARNAALGASEVGGERSKIDRRLFP